MTPSPPVVLGTAQLTSRYGVTDARADDPSTGDALDLLRAAAALGIGAVDTAPVYGTAEAVIGASSEPFVVHTKVRAGQLPSASLAESRCRLGDHEVGILYLHDPDEVLRGDGPTLRDARALAAAGEVCLGASVYDLAQFDAALADPAVTAVQVPINLLDRRFSGDALRRASDAGTRVVVRSVLLQGVLAADADHLSPTVAHLAPHVRRVAVIAAEHDCTPLELALGWVASLPHLHGVVLGATSTAELTQLMAAADARLPAAALDALDAMPLPEASACDPRTWAV